MRNAITSRFFRMVGLGMLLALSGGCVSSGNIPDGHTLSQESSPTALRGAADELNQVGVEKLLEAIQNFRNTGGKLHRLVVFGAYASTADLSTESVASGREDMEKIETLIKDFSTRLDRPDLTLLAQKELAPLQHLVQQLLYYTGGAEHFIKQVGRHVKTAGQQHHPVNDQSDTIRKRAAMITEDGLHGRIRRVMGEIKQQVTSNPSWEERYRLFAHRDYEQLFSIQKQLRAWGMAEEYAQGLSDQVFRLRHQKRVREDELVNRIRETAPRFYNALNHPEQFDLYMQMGWYSAQEMLTLLAGAQGYVNIDVYGQDDPYKIVGGLYTLNRDGQFSRIAQIAEASLQGIRQVFQSMDYASRERLASLLEELRHSLPTEDRIFAVSILNEVAQDPDLSIAQKRVWLFSFFNQIRMLGRITPVMPYKVNEKEIKEPVHTPSQPIKISPPEQVRHQVVPQPDDVLEVPFILFKRGDSLRFSAAQKKALDRFVQKAKEDPELKIRIYGRADPLSGTPRRNQRLSWRRAFRVKEYLERRGFPSNQIVEYRGLGTVKPIRSTNRREFARLNRSVEIVRDMALSGNTQSDVKDVSEDALQMINIPDEMASDTVEKRPLPTASVVQPALTRPLPESSVRRKASENHSAVVTAHPFNLKTGVVAEDSLLSISQQPEKKRRSDQALLNNFVRTSRDRLKNKTAETKKEVASSPTPDAVSSSQTLDAIIRQLRAKGVPTE
ncbi:OmpA family protein [Magnetococcales bacterium HHB-1]